MKEIIIGFNGFVGRWISNQLQIILHPEDTSIGLLSPKGDLIAGVLYQDFNRSNIVVHIAAEAGGAWMNRKFLRMIFDYPFNQLGVKRLTAPVAAKNMQSRRFVEHLGFVAEATLKDALPDDDLILYCMRRENCRWLSLKDSNHG